MTADADIEELIAQLALMRAMIDDDGLGEARAKMASVKSVIEITDSASE